MPQNYEMKDAMALFSSNNNLARYDLYPISAFEYVVIRMITTINKNSSFILIF